MSKFLFSVLTLFSVNISYVFAEKMSAEALLTEMSEASQQLNYELSYILVKTNNIEPLLYRHANKESQQFAHLIYLSGPSREVIRRGNAVSYIEPNIEPFTIESPVMVAPILPMLNSNIKQLAVFYDFIPLGRGREAGAPCQMIRVVPKDGLRYSYVLWIDEKNNLPLRADLIDRDGEIIEQYRTVSFVINDQLADAMEGLNHVKLPEVLSLPKSNVTQSFWQVNWVPDGFKAREINRYRMIMTERPVESQMFSDGLFNFSIYVAKNDEHSFKEQFIRQGRRTLHSFVSGDNEISIVGDIPLSTAKRIAQSIVFNVDGKDSKQ